MLVLILFKTLLLSGFAQTTCDRDSVRDQMKYIYQNYTYRDVSVSVDIAKKNISACGGARAMGVSETFLDQIKMTSIREEYKRIKEDIETFSENGRVEMFELEYRMYARKAGLSPAEVEAFLKKHKSQGAQSAVKERQSCSPVDMSKDFGPVRNQDSVGWCYAFAAADLVSYKLKKTVSAADIAISYNDGILSDIRKTLGTTADDIQGGFTAGAIDSTLKKGFCLEKDFPSEDNSSSNFKNTLQAIDAMGRQKLGASATDCAPLYHRSRALFPNVKIADLQAVLRESSSRDFIDNMADKTCEPRVKANMETEANVYVFDKKGMIQDLDEQLNKMNPVVLGYDSSNLIDRRDTEKRRMHASVIAGRRFNEKSGQCEYLIRNSWGRGCGYDRHYECKEGNIWVPKTDIMKRGKFLDYVK
ncbi:MAG: hypothetical protein OM95_07510 [Bdellovibrio sp. ArHS]|uniref:C1 family peptidase n=1 Tax=Bdellovibrio sp. ArHS TaxID=1569284 RepID=UPI00058262EF|nr:C1 family peptidase [Bdellovibrio sp. ArHS]KHD88644.1 MAG: hypothetical protein OM95_07510 [Bdellovibrio sp. ArHS]